MIHLLWNYMCGVLVIEIQGSSTERFVNMCAHHGINVWDLNTTTNIYTFKIHFNDLSDLKNFSNKLGVEFRIKSSYGIPFLIKNIIKRPVFIPGMLIATLLIYMYTLLLWDIRIDGNSRYSEEEITKFLNQNNFNVSMFKSNIDTANIVSLIRNNFPDIIWVSSHVEGSALIIKVKENLVVDDGEVVLDATTNKYVGTSHEDEHFVTMIQGTDIIAQEDGIVTTIITRNGVPLVHVGDEVKKGQVLVSGRLELANDYDELIGFQYVEADADIYIQNEIVYKDDILLTTEYKEYAKFPIYSFYLKIGSVYMNTELDLDDNFYWETNTTEYQIHPPKQNKYSILLGLEKHIKYEFHTRELSENEIKTTLSLKFAEYVSEMQEKGVEIIENNVNIVIEQKFAVASGVLKVSTHNTQTQITDYIDLELVSEE